MESIYRVGIRNGTFADEKPKGIRERKKKNSSTLLTELPNEINLRVSSQRDLRCYTARESV